MLFISDVHHGLDSLKLLPKTKEPLVILGDLINWIDYRNGDGIAKDVFGDDNLNRYINGSFVTESERDALNFARQSSFLQRVR